MVTRSITFLYGTKFEGKLSTMYALCAMYRKFDGYPSAHGVELATFLTMIERDKENLRDMTHITLRLLNYFYHRNTEDFILYPPRDGIYKHQEYEYHVFQDMVLIVDKTGIIYENPWEELMTFCKGYVQPET